MKKIIFLLPLFIAFNMLAQVNGGEYIFEFLRLSRSPHVSALGGISVASPGGDVMLSTGNPALLRPDFHTQLGLNHNVYYAGTGISNLYYAHHAPGIQTTFGFGLQYLNYGNFTLTDPVGQIQGEAKGRDFAFQLSASRSYLNRWRYGATLQYARSLLVDQKASALMMDFGVAYADTISQWYLGAVVKNAGLQIKKYELQQGSQPLPIDLQIGLTKKFKKAPFTIMVVGHHLYRWDVRYDNPADQTDNQLFVGDSSNTVENKTYFADKLFRHLVFALDVNLGKRIEISAGYNHMRRAELALDEKKGMSGFAFGAGIYLNKFVIHYAQSHYHLAGAYHEFGLNFKLNQLFGFGPGGKKIHWGEKFTSAFPQW